MFQGLEKENTDENKPSGGKCPNTSNPYHECSEYCHKKWGTSTDVSTNEVSMSLMDVN